MPVGPPSANAGAAETVKTAAAVVDIKTGTVCIFSPVASARRF
jgi:hypothetical protein